MKKNIFLICSGTENEHLSDSEINNIERQTSKIFYIIRNNENADGIKIITSDINRAQEISTIISKGLKTTYEVSKFLQCENRTIDELAAYEVIQNIMAEIILVVTHQNYIQYLLFQIARTHGLSLCYDVKLNEGQMISLNLNRNEKGMIIY
jgi:broad specificity phosphatase PhoE